MRIWTPRLGTEHILRKTVCLLTLAVALLFASCQSMSAISVREVKQAPESFRDRLVKIRGHGVAMATLPLCEGYMGLDKRTVFTDAGEDSIVAVVPASSFGEYHADGLRLFEGYVRIFSGELGCPGETRFETFPYFEITGVE